MYTVDYFIKKFEAIPEYLLCTGLTYNGASCALGHSGYKFGNRFSEEAKHLSNLLIDNGIDSYNCCKEKYLIPHRYWVVAGLNDGYNPKYQQLTPKQRILAALHDIKKTQEAQGHKPQYTDITASLAVLPVEERADQPVKELQKV